MAPNGSAAGRSKKGKTGASRPLQAPRAPRGAPAGTDAPCGHGCRYRECAHACCVRSRGNRVRHEAAAAQAAQLGAAGGLEAVPGPAALLAVPAAPLPIPAAPLPGSSAVPTGEGAPASDSDSDPVVPRRSGRKRRRLDDEQDAEPADKDNKVETNEGGPANAAGSQNGSIAGNSVLVRVSDTIDLELEDRPARLTTQLQVEVDADSKSRLGYQVSLFVSYDLADREEIGAPAGHLSSWRIDKPTATNPQSDAIWEDELLAQAAAKKAGVFEPAKCLQCLFTRDGAVGEQVTNREARHSLSVSSLLFIGVIMIDDAFRGQGLLRRVLDQFYSLLRRLPEWYAFHGNIILVPGKPTDIEGGIWTGKTDAEVEHILTEIYKKAGYAVWAEKTAVKTSRFEAEIMTVMGRSIE
ncbi:hypothetical protein LTR62_004095 [Meristemomyces frigidus]|uniref:N-acetyltransferase domain-containing protein n=1 Tax=Meristemomyces frigidus TaxID=1508187 RepID=A0AAN7TQ79_9PEZI|nr:hypothetical protein LTR62_004095 [Meristemomyces frigidus]